MVCPCKLVLDMEYCFGKWETVFFDLWDVKPIVTEEFRPDFNGKGQYDIKRGFWTATAFAGVKDAKVVDGVVHISPGCQSDELYAFSSRIDATGEEVIVNVIPHKQYACLTIDLSSYNGDGDISGIELVGNIAGIDLKDLTPVEGKFDVIVGPRGAGLYDVLIPRQKDTSLKLLLLRGEEIVDTFAIGEQIVQEGYDWTAEDLEDLTVKFSYIRAEVAVEVESWDVCDSLAECVF